MQLWWCFRLTALELLECYFEDPAEDVPVPWLDSVNIVWPMLLAVCTKFEKNIRIIEHYCRAVRFIIRSLGVQSIVFVEQLVSQVLLPYFSRIPHLPISVVVREGFFDYAFGISRK